MKNSILLILTFLTYRPLISQPRIGLEQYFCSGSSTAAAPVTRVYYQTAAKGYLEARYNYDAEKSIGISAGRRFDWTPGGSNAPTVTLTPTAGMVAGSSQGFLLGANCSAGYRNWNFSSAIQFSPMKNGGYLYNWSELGHSIAGNGYLGAALQQDCRSGCGCRLSTGLIGQLSFGGWNLPVYIFNPFDKGVWLLAGVTREWVFHKKNEPSKKSPTSP